MLWTTPAMDFVTYKDKSHQPTYKINRTGQIWRFAIHSTCFIVTAVWTLEATASTLALIRRKFTDWFFCLMAFSAWIRATSMFPFWIAWRTHEHDAPQQKYAVNTTFHCKYWLRRQYLLFLLWASLLFLLCHIFWSFFVALWWQTLNWKDVLQHGIKEISTHKSHN